MIGRSTERRPVPLRLRIFQGGILLLLALLALRLWDVQILSGDYYRRLADQNRYRLVTIPALRGVIYDRTGVLLARNVPRFQVSLIPAYLPEDEGARQAILWRLARLLDIPYQRKVSFGGLARTGQVPPAGLWEREEEGRIYAPYVPIVLSQDVPREVAFYLEENHLDFPGVVVEVRGERSYPTGALTAHLVGYTGAIPSDQLEEYQERGYKLDDVIGLTGIEAVYEDLLRGQKGMKYVEVDVAGREVRTVGDPLPPRPGYNLVLTLDLDLQTYVTRVLSDGMRVAGAEQGVAIVMDPRDGQILSMVSLPSYDNNLFVNGISVADFARLNRDPNRPLVNHAIAGQYPPGSTFKLVTAAAGLETGVIAGYTRLSCPLDSGILWLPNKYFPDDPKLAQPFYCWIHVYGIGHGPLDVVDALAQSCDIFFYEVAGGYGPDGFVGVGLEELARYAHLFGYGEQTGVDLPGELSGLIPTAKWKRVNYGESWTTGDTYNMGIGQGYVLATPLQVLNAAAAIANGGTLYRPQLLYEVRDSEGRVVKTFEPQVIRQLDFDPETIRLIQQGLVDAVERGTAQRAQIPGLRVAGKTGTAEFYDPRFPPDEKGNLPTHAWFVAYAPADDPQLAVVVFLYNGGEGSVSAVPIAAKILRYYFQID